MRSISKAGIVTISVAVALVLLVAHTQRRNGVFVVPAHRQVIVLADDGAQARIDHSVWHDVASQIAAAFARGEGTSGLIDGVGRLASVLREPFSHERDDINELPDQPDTQGFA